MLITRRMRAHAHAPAGRTHARLHARASMHICTHACTQHTRIRRRIHTRTRTRICMRKRSHAHAHPPAHADSTSECRRDGLPREHLLQCSALWLQCALRRPLHRSGTRALLRRLAAPPPVPPSAARAARTTRGSRSLFPDALGESTLLLAFQAPGSSAAMGSYTTCAADGSSCATYPWPQARWRAVFSFARVLLHAGFLRRAR
jgi:hypothetical protein